MYTLTFQINSGKEKKKVSCWKMFDVQKEKIKKRLNMKKKL